MEMICSVLLLYLPVSVSQDGLSHVIRLGKNGLLAIFRFGKRRGNQSLNDE